MSKNNKNSNNSKSKKTEIKSFELHTEAIDKLLTASPETAPEVDKKELKEYKKDTLSKIPAWVKAWFIKFWFNGAVCFFFVWGLGVVVPNVLDLLVVTGLACGIVTDLLVNNAFRFFDEDNEYLRWTMFPQKKIWTFFANIIYAFIILFVVVLFYSGGNLLILTSKNLADGTAIIGVEPFLFGLVYLLVDLAFLSIKILIKKMISDANKKLADMNEQKK